MQQLLKTWIRPGACFVIAEAGVNHNGKLKWAYQLVDAAVSAKADAIKFQLFRPEKLTVANAPLAAYQKKTANAASQQELLSDLALDFTAMAQLKAYCDKKSIHFLCTPFDEEGAAFLVNELRVPFLKISSGDLTSLPFLKDLVQLRVPLLLSTGMATIDELQQVASFLKRCGLDLPLQTGWLHCISAYPAEDSALNLRAMAALQELFPHCVTGYSDHSLGSEAILAAVSLGAAVVEKHITLDTSLPGPDHAASLPVNELPGLIASIRRIEAMLGHGRKEPHRTEADVRRVARKSLVLSRSLFEGQVLTKEVLTCKRPGTGISPLDYETVLGKTLRYSLPADHVLQPDDLKA